MLDGVYTGAPGEAAGPRRAQKAAVARVIHGRALVRLPQGRRKPVPKKKWKTRSFLLPGTLLLLLMVCTKRRLLVHNGSLDESRIALNPFPAALKLPHFALYANKPTSHDKKTRVKN
jgi:hypothetical protein